MTSIEAGQPGKTSSRGRRAAGAAALVTILGAGGWAAAAGAPAPPPEPASRAVQTGDSSSVLSGTTGSVEPGSATPESVGLEFTALEPIPEPAVAPAPALAPPATRSGPQAPAVGEEPVTERPGAPGKGVAAPPVSPDPGTKAVGPPVAPGKTDQPPPVAAAKGFDKAADVANGVSIKVSGRKAVQGEARGVGEVGGPAIRFTLEVTNSTTEPISLADAVVNVEAGAGRFPAELLSGPEAVSFPAEVGAGQAVSGVFVFKIPPEQRGAVRVLFHYQPVSPVAAFEGSVPVQGEAP